MFEKEQLFTVQNECTLSWVCGDGSPAATIVSYVWHGGSVWMTALEGSARVNAIEKRGQCAIVVSGKGTVLGDARCVSMRGECTVHRDAACRDWFFPLFSQRVLPNSEQGAAGMTAMMNNATNTVLEFVPWRVVPYDAHEAMKAANKA